jgi:hypothetical protein
MTLKEALAVLCQVHTRPHPDLGFIVENMAIPEEALHLPGPMKNVHDYDHAWEVVRKEVGLKV